MDFSEMLKRNDCAAKSAASDRQSGLRDHSVQLLSAMSLAKLGEFGHTVDATSDLSVFEQEMMSIGARENHPMMSPRYNDFAEGDAFGLIVKDPLGGCCGGIAARFVDLGRDNLATHMEDNYQRLYGGVDKPAISSRLASSRQISGRVVYQGQWFFKQETRGGAVHTPALFHYFHSLSFVKWRPDWVYGFFPVKLAERAFSHGYAHTHMQAHNWHVDAERRGPGECLVYTNFEEFAERADSIVQYPDHFPRPFNSRNNS